MADLVFNIAKGAAVEKVRDSAANLLILFLKSGGENDAGIRDRDTVADILGASTEATASGYSRKTGITGTITVDDTNDRVDLDCPDQTWTAVASGDTYARAIVAYQESAADSGRVPLVSLDVTFVTDGSDLILQIATAGFYRAS